MELETIIRNRKSIRNYENRPLSEKDLIFVNDLIRNIEYESPFDVPVRIHLLEVSGKGTQKPGTYGVIRNAPAYLGITVRNSEFAMETVGFVFERMVLRLTERGIGTCWLAGTFKRDQFEKTVDIQDDELFPIVCPIGCPADKNSLINQVFRTASRSDQRRPWDELFFKDDFSIPLRKEEAGEYGFALEMLRLAPSGSNRQPWRILRKDGAFHFYRQANPGSRHPFDIQALDTGICASHFFLAAREKGLSGCFMIMEPPRADVPEGLRYLFSWKENRS